MKWELRKIIGNWRKTLVVFLLPAVLMMLALNIFPLLVNYLTTGSFGQRPVLVLDAPKSFREYVSEDGEGYLSSYTYEYDSSKRYTDGDKDLMKEIKKGRMIIVFDLDAGAITLMYNENSIALYSKAGQILENVLTPYRSYIENSEGDIFTVDDYNPVTDVLNYRATANTNASRIIPGILVLLMYYCVYSLASDMFASERDRGFLGKLLMTPVKPSDIMIGKTLAIIVITWGSSIVMFAVLFFSSWLNVNNDAMSLLPFGMFLVPKDLFVVFISTPLTAFVMTMLAVNMVFSLRKMQDIILNLQLPLVLLLVEFFLQMIRSVHASGIEFFIPVHNTICVLRDAYASEVRWYYVLSSLIVNFLAGYYIYKKNIPLFEGKEIPKKETRRERKKKQKEIKIKQKESPVSYAGENDRS